MTENKQDTITVELPIEADGPEYVKVDQVAIVTRERWREIAADPVGADASSLTATVAPAVVAWIERDEWEPLDVPEVGRTIKATLRDGREETFEVTTANDYGDGWVFLDAGYAIEREFDEDDHGPSDIIAWEYVDEDAKDALDLTALADQLQATLDMVKAAVK